MKLSLLSLLGLLFFSATSYGQFDQEEQSQSSTVEDVVERTIDKLEEISESMDLEEFFEEELPEFIEDITPTKEEIENFEAKIQNGINCMREFDASVIDDIIEDIEEGTEEIIEEIEEEIQEHRNSRRKSSKI